MLLETGRFQTIKWAVNIKTLDAHFLSSCLPKHNFDRFLLFCVVEYLIELRQLKKLIISEAID